MSEEISREEQIQNVLTIFHRTMANSPSEDFLVYATGLLLGVRSLLVTVDEWQRWGECAAQLLWARGAQPDGPRRSDPWAGGGEWQR